MLPREWRQVMRDAESPKDVLKPRWYLNRKQIIELTDMSRSTVHRVEAGGKSLSTQRIGGLVQDVVDWDRTGNARSPRLGVSIAPAKDGLKSNLSTELQ